MAEAEVIQNVDVGHAMADHLAALTALGADLSEHRAEVGQAVVRAVRTEVGEYYTVRSPDFLDAGWSALFALIENAAQALRAGDPTELAVPAALRAEAEAAARHGLTWGVLGRTYTVTHRTIWDYVIEHGIPRRDRWERDSSATLLRAASHALFRYFDWITDEVRAIFDASGADPWSPRERRLAELVRQALDGATIPDASLNYRTGLRHVGIVARGDGPVALVTAAAQRLSAELLWVPAPADYVHAWLGFAAEPTLEAVINALDGKVGVSFAMGSPAAGREGFVSTHRQAVLAAAVWARKAVPRTRAVTVYRDVALESLGLDNDVHAAVFVDHELRGLAGADARADTLRSTVLAYSECGLGVRATAARLGVAERTVRYRLDGVEQILGPDFEARLPQVVVAIRLLRSLAHQRATR